MNKPLFKWVIGGFLVVVLVLIGSRFIGGKSSDNKEDEAQNTEEPKNTDDAQQNGESVKLPSDWPSDAPIMPDANIQYSASADPQTDDQGAYVVFGISKSEKEVAEYYKKELPANGWTVSGVASTTGGTNINAGKDTRVIAVVIVPSGDTITVTIGVGKK